MHAEGSDEVGLVQDLKVDTVMFVDIVDHQAETVTWLGANNIRVTSPSGATQTIAASGTYDPEENGAHRIELTVDQVAAWDISVNGAVSGLGRLSSTDWHFNSGSLGEDTALNASFYALVPAGAGETGVIELRLDGLAGEDLHIGANALGVEGANGRSVPQEGNTFNPEHRLYLNPPEIATFSSTRATVEDFVFSGGPAGCDQVAADATSAEFSFLSDLDASYQLVCDLSGDGIFNRSGDEDLTLSGEVTAGENIITWDGRDNAGEPVPLGSYDCMLFVNSGEFHYIGQDIETSFEGLRMFSVDGQLGRSGLTMFWNDAEVQENAVTMPNDEVGLESSGPNGISSGSTTAANAPNVNSRAWGNFSGNGKGDGAFLDTYTFLNSVETTAVTLEVVDGTVDTDEDSLSDYQETCSSGTDPESEDSDGDGMPDPVESDDGQYVDTDGDGTVDGRDLDSDDDTLLDEDEKGDDPLDPVDTDGDGVPNYRDPDSDGDTIPDAGDNCAFDPNMDQSDIDGNSLGDACDDGLGSGQFGVKGGGCNVGGGSGAALALFALLGLVMLRRRRALPVALAVALVPSIAAAQSGVETEYSIERFRLASDREGILDVESADVAGHLSYDVGVWLGYSDDPLTLYRVGEEDDRVASLVSHRLAGTLVGSVALLSRFQLSVAMPMILSQDQDAGSELMDTLGAISSFGAGDASLGLKVQLVGAAEAGLDIAAAIGMTVPTGDGEDYMGDGRATVAPELLLSRRIGLARFGANLGYRARRARRAIDLEIDDELFAHAGVGYMVAEQIELDATFSLATAASDAFGDFNRNYTEGRLGGAIHLGRAVVFAGAGAGLSEGFGAPDWRALAGVRFGERKPEDQPAPLVIEKRVAERVETPTDVDTDDDGIINSADRCPENAEDVDNFEDHDGCPEQDNDNDEILDGADKCPNQPGLPAFEGCPEPDRDNDGVPDARDNCPETRGHAEFQGCLEKQLVKISTTRLVIVDKVYFDVAKATIQPMSHPLLRNIASVLEAHPEIKKLRIEGHTDNQGSDVENKKLSEQRARSVVEFLVSAGVARSRLEAVGYGEEKPLESNETEAGRSVNRRVEFNIVGGSESTTVERVGPDAEDEAPAKGEASAPKEKKGGEQ